MENIKELWARKTRVIWIGKWIPIFGCFVGLAVCLALSAFVTGKVWPLGFMTMFIIFTLSLVLGYALSLIGLIRLQKILNEKDGEAIKWLILSHLFLCLLNFINIFFQHQLFNAIIGIPSFVLTLMAFHRLKNSGTFPYKATKGARLLYFTFIIGFIGLVIARLSPFFGMVSLVLLVTMVVGGVVVNLVGWYYIKSADPTDYLDLYTPVTEE